MKYKTNQIRTITNITTNDMENSVMGTNERYEGMMRLAQLLYYKGLHLEEEDKYQNEEQIIEAYKQASQIHGCYAQGLAIYYEKMDYPIDDVEQQYTIAIANDHHAGPIVNFADYYKKQKMYIHMVDQLIVAVEKYEDVESMAVLALHYAKLNDSDNVVKYYNMALECVDEDTDIDIHTRIECIELINVMNILKTSKLDTKNSVYEKLEEIYRQNDAITIYNNKLRLFTKLNHVEECEICCNTELHLNLHCGHCVCKNCYIQLLNKPCPYCRQ